MDTLDPVIRGLPGHLSPRLKRTFTKFSISILFYQITNVQCVYWSNTTVFIGRIRGKFYISYNYMLRRLIMAFFRFYMKYLLNFGAEIMFYFNTPCI